MFAHSQVDIPGSLAFQSTYDHTYVQQVFGTFCWILLVQFCVVYWVSGGACDPGVLGLRGSA